MIFCQVTIIIITVCMMCVLIILIQFTFSVISGIMRSHVESRVRCLYLRGVNKKRSTEWGFVQDMKSIAKMNRKWDIKVMSLCFLMQAACNLYNYSASCKHKKSEKIIMDKICTWQFRYYIVYLDYNARLLSCTTYILYTLHTLAKGQCPIHYIH